MLTSEMALNHLSSHENFNMLENHSTVALCRVLLDSTGVNNKLP